VIAIALLLALDLSGYQRELQGIDARLGQGDTKGAAAAAHKLLEQKLDDGLSPDAWTLQPIADGTPHRTRLSRLLQTLQAPQTAPTADAQNVLKLVRERQAAKGGKAGGELGDVALREPTLMQAVLDDLQSGAEWAWDKVVRFFKWLDNLFPDDARVLAGKPGGGVRLLPFVLVLVGLILVFVIALAVRAALRPEPLQAEAASDKASSKKDDDPLSRTAGGWEERALALAAEGRFREAIRAWYHALLVHAAAAGFLHYQRGRTNWEYVHAMSPAVSWRPVFADLTRLFEREWYGRAESREEELHLFQRDARQILASLRSAG
jgi:Domain of unknown function (DUF4129)